MSADCETNPISPLFSVCRYTEGSKAMRGEVRPKFANCFPEAGADFAPPAPCDKGVGSAVSLNRIGAKCSSTCNNIWIIRRPPARANLIPQLPGLARLQRARFLGPAKKITSFFGIKSCAVKIGEKMLKSAYS